MASHNVEMIRKLHRDRGHDPSNAEIQDVLDRLSEQRRRGRLPLKDLSEDEMLAFLAEYAPSFPYDEGRWPLLTFDWSQDAYMMRLLAEPVQVDHPMDLDAQAQVLALGEDVDDWELPALSDSEVAELYAVPQLSLSHEDG